MKIINLKIVKVKINKLKPAKYNPRKITKEKEEDLITSIKTFGLVDPIISNQHKGRENIVIGGHQRLRIAKMLGHKDVPVLYLDLDIEKEKELNLRLNNNIGEWDWELLRKYDEEFLLKVGFDKDEIFFDEETDEKIADSEILTVEPPEAPVLKERASFYFNNLDDYQAIIDYFGGEKKINGDKLINLIKQ